MDGKRYSDWKGNLDEFLKIGDLVDEEFVEYFINVLPPACMSSSVIQIGEPYSYRNGKATFSTLYSSSEGWRYGGNCFRGQKDNIE